LRALLGSIYLLLGAAVLIRTISPIDGLSLAKLPPAALGAAFIGLGVLRVRDFLLLRKSTST
jgi:hypothetical protein